MNPPFVQPQIGLCADKRVRHLWCDAVPYTYRNPNTRTCLSSSPGCAPVCIAAGHVGLLATVSWVRRVRYRVRSLCAGHQRCQTLSVPGGRGRVRVPLEQSLRAKGPVGCDSDDQGFTWQLSRAGVEDGLRRAKVQRPVGLREVHVGIRDQGADGGAAGERRIVRREARRRAELRVLRPLGRLRPAKLLLLLLRERFVLAASHLLGARDLVEPANRYSGVSGRKSALHRVRWWWLRVGYGRSRGRRIQP